MPVVLPAAVSPEPEQWEASMKLPRSCGHRAGAAKGFLSSAFKCFLMKVALVKYHHELCDAENGWALPGLVACAAVAVAKVGQ